MNPHGDAKLGKSQKVLEFVDIYKSFGSQEVCRGLNLQVKKGEVLSILGPSGCGKTVTIKMLIGLVLPDSGHIFYDGLDLAAFEKEDEFLPVRKKISMVFQGAALFDSMNVFDNIAYPLHVIGGLRENEIKEKVHETLELVGLPDSVEKMPSELSGGMKKRIGLARAIVCDPEIVLYDEPTAGLDPINTRRIIDLILELKARFNCTSIVITHDMFAVQQLGGDVSFFYGGHVRQTGTYQELCQSQDAIVRGFVLGNPNLLLTSHGSQ